MSHVHRARGNARLLIALAALVAGLLVGGLAYGAAPAAAAYPSNDCDTGGTVVLDGYVADGYYKLRTTTGPDGARWICVAVDDGARHFGGKVVVSGGSGSPTEVDDNWAACGENAGRIFREGGAVGPIPFEVEVEQAPGGGVQVCVMANGSTLAKRIAIRTSALPGATFLPDDPQPYPYAETPSNATASAACQNTGVGQKERLVNAQIEAHHVWLYTWQESSSRYNVCWRVSSPLASTHAWPYGGRVVIDTTRQQQVVVAQDTQDFTSCDQNLLTLTETGVVVRYHAPQTGPKYVCLQVRNVVSKRIQVWPGGPLGVVSIIGDV